MTTWQDVNREILDALDLESIYREMGLVIEGGAAQNGWAACKVFGANERDASAGVNLRGEHPLKGRYKAFTGECENLSFFEFCVKAGKFETWSAARDHFRKELKIKVPAKNAKKPVAERLAFRDYNEALVRSWCLHKPPIKPWAVRIAGGRLAGYPATSNKYTCVVLPVFGPHGVDDDPCGWVAYNKSGKPLPLSQGKGNPPKMLKVKTIEGSSAGWMGAYGLANLEKAEVVWKTEGPADLLALQSAIPPLLHKKHVVVTNSSGTLGVLSDDHLDLLAGKTVYIVHDADRDGQAGGEKWAEALSYVAAEVRHVQLPYEIREKHGPDLRDWINEAPEFNVRFRTLLELAETFPIVTPPQKVTEEGETVNEEKDPLACDRLICERLKLDVLGELPGRKIKVFSELHRKTATIENINRLSRADLMQIAGNHAREYVFDGKSDEAGPNQFHILQVREAIAVLAGLEQLDDSGELGMGVWQGGRDHTDDLVLVGPGQALVIDASSTITSLGKPRVSGLMVNLDAPREARWFELKTLKENLQAAADLDWRVKQIDQLCKLFDKWNWRTADVASCSSVLTGLVLATWVQSIWRWRPLVSVVGPSNCGKSSFFKLLEKLFGSLVIEGTKSTEAGIRQETSNSSKIILCDEFEEDKHRRQVLELFRTGNRGSTTLRGTTGQTAKKFGLKHIPWMFAIEIGLKRAPDRNRFISFELRVPKKTKRGLELPDDTELAALGQRLLAVALWSVREADHLTECLKEISVDGIHERVVESFATPTAILAVACGLTSEQAATDLLHRLLGGVDQDPTQGTKDETTLLGDIMSSIVRLGHGEEASVGQILDNVTASTADHEAMERHGVVVAYNNRFQPPKRTGVFFAGSNVAKHLLKDPAWSGEAITQVLGRMEGAQRKQYKCGGHRPSGVLVDWELLDRKFLTSPDEEVSDGF